MKRIVFIAFMMLAWVGAWAGNNIKIKVEGPEEAYNLVRVVNQTSFSDFNLTVYYLRDSEGKQVVESVLGRFDLKGKGDVDSVKAKTVFGQWLGVLLPDEMSEVQAIITYKDLPAFDIVYITLVEGNAMKVGEEF